MAKYNHFKVDLSNKESTHSKVLNLVGKNKSVLDIGCASGYLSKTLKDEFNCKVWGLDNDKESLEIAKKSCEETFLFNLETDSFAKVLKNKKFDVALMADVLEHLKDPKTTLEMLIPHINEHLVISVPNISHEAVIYELLSGQFNYRSLGLLDDTHIHFFTLDSLTKTLEELGLVIDDVQRTLITAEQSEFKTKLENFPEGVRSYIDSLPHIKDYQYIIKASKPKKNSLNLTKRYIKLREEKSALNLSLEGYKESLQEKEIEISALKEELSQKALKNEALTEKVEELQTNENELNELLDWKKIKIRELSGIFYKKRAELNELQEKNQELTQLKANSELQKEEIFHYQREISRLRLQTGTAHATSGKFSKLNLLRIIKNKKSAQILSEERKVASMFPKVAIFTLSYNSEKWIPNYLKAIKEIDYPSENLSLHILDNASSDSSYDVLVKSVNGSKDFPFPVLIQKSDKNLGFAGGNNFLLKSLKENEAEYVFLLNIDSEIDTNCISKLIKTAQKDPSIGMVEAKQLPKEHPKWYDPQNFETGWCSGGGVLIKKEAIERVGFFDERYFLYCEDVDLSWRMWLQGYRCLFCPEATYHHFTEDQDPNKDLTIQTFYSIRNSFYMHFKYDSIQGIKQHIKNINQVIDNEQEPERRKLLEKAKKSALRNSPRFLKDRLKIKAYPHIPWTVFNGFDFERRRDFIDTPDGKRKIINS